MKHSDVLFKTLNKTREEFFIRNTRKIVKQFQEGVVPILGGYGMLDEERVQKYLRCDSFEDIYKDIIADKERAQLFKLLSLQGIEPEKRFKYTTLELPEGESEYIVSDDTNAFGHPIKLIRQNTQRVEKSRWMPIPGSDISGNDRDGRPMREVILSFIKWKGGALQIDFAAIRAASYYQPTKAHCAVYDAIADCIDTLKSYGISNCDEIRDLFWYGKPGTIPFTKNIMYNRKLMKKP